MGDPMKPINLTELRKAVFARHGLSVPIDDPVLLTVTVNELMLDRYIKLVSKQIEDQPPLLAKALDANLGKATAIGEKLVNEASAFVADTIKLAVRDALADARNLIQSDLSSVRAAEQAVAGRAASSSLAQQAAWCAAAVAGCAAFIAIVVLLWAVIRLASSAG